MAYRESTTSTENLRLLKRTLTGIADFSGRSRRTEVLYYAIATALAGIVLIFLMATIFPFRATIYLGAAFRLVVMVLVFALFVRRLHDQNRSGWWGLLLPFAFLLTVPMILTELGGDVEAIFAQRRAPLTIVGDTLQLGLLVLWFWPGTDGENRYGPDPRLDNDLPS
ncbi:MAG: DUF805 domain-containing protein [Sphingomonadales bacterium]|nr:DUF805 domain-containing protein [Sphingomonadales bacterium]